MQSSRARFPPSGSSLMLLLSPPSVLFQLPVDERWASASVQSRHVTAVGGGTRRTFRSTLREPASRHGVALSYFVPHMSYLLFVSSPSSVPSLCGPDVRSNVRHRIDSAPQSTRLIVDTKKWPMDGGTSIFMNQLGPESRRRCP